MADDSELVKAALEARKFSYAPYSGFMVGAALLCDDGSAFSGCNIENAAYGETICAERTAFLKALSEGKRNFSAIAIAGAPKGEAPSKSCPPCGSCRQVMAEFCDPDNFRVLLGRADLSYEEYKLKNLLPLGFTAEGRNLGKEKSQSPTIPATGMKQ